MGEREERTVTASRVEFLDRALALYAVPYIWGGKSERGVDCSGLVTVALFGAGGEDWRFTYSSEVMREKLPVTLSPRQGDLVLYGQKATATEPEKASHVMILLSDVEGGDAVLLGACGGGPKVTNHAEANRAGARVKRKRLAKYRTDEVLGFRRLPFAA